ncbi:hypothetical protein [Polaribacter glomeratus]|uniref:Uncharacterized protein n=1 Tax=Polaribacter glomeratus TaxID=102 RepID=A0A2S7WUJ1_9FLAO|nr:hypothetical protein [Polaribacter glomeratus]PQJ81263.1 hypothetical protein BTO16_01095 [Polaribacter glomeratus]
MIDTDTVMPAISHYNFCDAISTICNTENENDVSKVEFNFKYYKAYEKGFLTDYLNSDIF